MRRSVLSLATADGRYPRQLDRLRGSLADVGFSGDVRFWRPGSCPAACPRHTESPFAFKPFAFSEVQTDGGELALWLDASCVVVRAMDDAFATIERQGYLLFANGRHRVGEWASDVALARLGVSRDEALAMPEVNAAAIGLNLRHPVATEFLAAWLDAARDGVAFRGAGAPFVSRVEYLDVKWNHRGRASVDPRVRGHRHDQTVAGIIAHRLGMQLTAGWLESVSGGRPVRPGTIIVIDRDGGRSAPMVVVAAIVRRHAWLKTLIRRIRRAWLGLGLKA